MAVTTKKNFKFKRGRKNDGGLVDPIEGMNYSERKTYLSEKYVPHIVSSSMVFRIGEDHSFDYDLVKGDRSSTIKRLIEHYKSIADYTESNLADRTIYRMDGWELERGDFDPETEEVIETEELEKISAGNSYNSSYLGIMDLDWRVYYDDVYDKYFYVIHPHLGGDPRGNYGEAFILEGDDKDDLVYRFIMEFLNGNATVHIEFDDGSYLTYHSQQDSDVFLFETDDVPEIGTFAYELYDDLERLPDFEADETLQELVELSTDDTDTKMALGGEADEESEEDEPMVMVVNSKGDKKWFDLSEYSDGDDVINDVEEFADYGEYTFDAWKGFGREKFDSYMAESDFDEVITWWEAYERSDYPLGVIKEFMSDESLDDYDEAIRTMEDKYYGAYSDLSELAEQMVDEGILTPTASDMFITDTDKRMIGIDMADSHVSDMPFEDALRLADMQDEYEERKTELEDRINSLEDRISTLEDLSEEEGAQDYEVSLEAINDLEVELEERQEELDNLPEEFDSQVREKAREKYSDEIEDRLENDLEDWLEEMGYTDNLNEVNFLRIDYDSLAQDLRHDYRQYQDDGKSYVFHYEGGGKVKVGNKKPYPYYVVEMTTKKVVSGHESKKIADSKRKELISKKPKLRFSVYDYNKLKDKYNIKPKNPSNWLDFNMVGEADKASIKRAKKGMIVTDHLKEHERLAKELHDLKRSCRNASDEELKSLEKDVDSIKSEMRKIKAQHFKESGSLVMRRGGRIGRGARRAGSWVKRQWHEADFGDGKGEAKFLAGGQPSQLVYVDNKKLGRIDDVITKYGREKYVVRTPDGRKRLGRFDAHRLTLAEEGLEVGAPDANETSFSEFDELISFRNEDDVEKARKIWDSWSDEDKHAFYLWWIEEHSTFGIDEYTGEKVTVDVARREVNYLLYDQFKAKGGSVKGTTKKRVFKSGKKSKKRSTYEGGGEIISNITSSYQTAGADENGVWTYSKSTADEIAKKYNGEVQEDGSKWYVDVSESFKEGGETWIQDATEEMKKKGTVGAFTKQANRAGMKPVEFAKEVLSNPDDYTEKTRQRAQFVKNANPEKFD